jgi:hypothetical protein
MDTCSRSQNQRDVIKHQLSRGDIAIGNKSTPTERRLGQDPLLTVAGQAGQLQVLTE